MKKVSYFFLAIKKSQAKHTGSYYLIIFRSHRFRNVQVEVLYQRYFLRMNQNNMASLLGLLVCISVALVVVNHLLYPNSQHSILQVRFQLRKIQVSRRNHETGAAESPPPEIKKNLVSFRVLRLEPSPSCT